MSGYQYDEATPKRPRKGRQAPQGAPIERRPLLRAIAPKQPKPSEGPQSNTAPEPTRQNGRKASQDLVDCLWVTWHNVAVDAVLSLVYQAPGVPTPVPAHGNRGYASSAGIGAARIFWDGRGSANGTVHLQLLGQALREWELYHQRDAVELVRLVVARGGRLTRLDLAHDDREGVLDLDKMRRCTIPDRRRRHQSGDDPSGPARGIRTRFKGVDEHWGRQTKEGNEHRKGLTFGSGKSHALLRIYDKALEQNAPDEGHWIRLELQLRDDRAQVIAERMHEGEDMGTLLRQTVSHYLAFIQRTSDTNASRAKLTPWWRRWLRGCTPRKLGVPDLPATLLRRIRWMMVAWPKQLALLQAAMGKKGSTKFLRRLTVGGWARLLACPTAHGDLQVLQRQASHVGRQARAMLDAVRRDFFRLDEDPITGRPYRVRSSTA